MTAHFDNLEQVARFYKAWSEPLRLRILFLLAEFHEVCVCDLVSCLDVNQSVVSRHLNYLKQSEMVEDTRRANWRYYRLSEFVLQHPALQSLLSDLKSQPQIETDLKQFSATTSRCDS